MAAVKDVPERYFPALRGCGPRPTMPDFEPLPEHHLQRLTDEALIEYVGAARAGGDEEATALAMGMLAYGWEDKIRSWVAWKVPAQDVDDVVLEAQISIVKASFDGKLVGQLGAFMKRIADRRIADYYRSAARHGEHVQVETGREEDEATHQAAVDDETGFIAVMDVVEIVLTRRSPPHQKVIRLYGSEVFGFEDLSAEEVRARIEADGSGESVSVDNVAKIWSRFRQEVEDEIRG